MAPEAPRPAVEMEPEGAYFNIPLEVAKNEIKY